MIKANHLRVDCDAEGESLVTLWCEMGTADDIVDIIEWLKLAKAMMEKWKAIRCPED